MRHPGSVAHSDLLHVLRARAGHRAEELERVLERIAVAEHVALGRDRALQRQAEDGAETVALALVKLRRLGILHREEVVEVLRVDAALEDGRILEILVVFD